MQDFRQTPAVPLKLMKRPGAVAAGLLEEQVAVEEHRLHAREHRVGAVQVAPAGLDHADLGVGKIVHGAFEDIRVRDEVRVEDEDKLALCRLEPVFQGASLEARAVGAVDVRDVETADHKFADELGGELAGFVGGVVEHLHVDQVLRVVELGNGFQEPLDDVEFVKDGQLNGDARQLVQLAERHRGVAPVL